MLKIFTDNAWSDYLYWQNQDRKTLKRINKLIRDIESTPFVGLGKSESLRFDYTGY
ncbi:Txe/YoeB family toxin of toxin-antitoxin system [Enterococcus sp. PF1-24]|nr:Txe/YoeB family toxin of toxin-antitoxin system [Enterococcus sp. PFB1-1]MDH6401490.1 Txe/YoeB family toxin of toxin-antitoxin system [Enterococcus sp. PF1-24]